MRGDADGCRYDNQIFDDVLAFKSGSKKSLPGDLRKDKERQDRHDHMNHQKGYGCPFKSTNEKYDSNEHFKQPKEKNEFIESNEGEKVML